MDKEHFTSKSRRISVKPKPTDLLVFDIETVPIADDKLTETQKEYIQKKLDRIKARDPNADLKKEESTLRGTDSYLAQVVCIGLYYPMKGTQIALTNPSEKTILESFWTQISGYNGLFISFNGIRFDVPFLIRRSLAHGLLPSNMSFLNYTKYNPFPPHFDVYLALGGRENPISLKAACDLCGVESPKEGTVRAENVSEAYNEGRINEIAEYCVRDLKSTYKLYEKVRPFVTN